MKNRKKIFSELPPQQRSAPNVYGTIGVAVPPVPSTMEVKSKTMHDAAQNFTLQKINESKLFLESERDSRRIVAKKYKRRKNILTSFAYALETAVVGLGAAGIELLTTVEATPIAVGMEIISIGTGALSVTVI